MSERILVTGKKISSMELVTNVTGNEKIPTGQQDDLAITPNQITDYAISRSNLVSRSDLSQVESDLGSQISDLASDIAAEESARIAADNLKVDKEGSVSSVAGRVGDVVLAPSDVLVGGFGSQEGVNKYIAKPFLSGYTYGLGERVVLDDGEVVKSLIDGNVSNPNADMTGWISTVSDSLSGTVQTFTSPEAGVDTVTGVRNGSYFNVQSSDDDGFLVEYQNVGGVPTPTGKSYPDSDFVQDQLEGLNLRSDSIQNELDGLNSKLAFNTVNVLDYIPKSQHTFIEKGQLDLQDQTLVTAGLNAASAYAKTLRLVKFVVPAGEYATNDTVLIDLPSGSRIEFDGYIATSVIAKPAVIIGSYDTNRFYYKISDIAAYHRDIPASIAGDPDRLSAGVLLLNIVACTGNIKRSRGFSHGVWMLGTQSNGGCSYNHITLGFLKENIYPIRLSMGGVGGYCNENTFYGGSMGHGGSFPYTGDEIDIKVDTGSETQTLNNNMFFRPSLESNNASTKAAVLEGKNNQIYMPRMENSQNYGSFTIEFGETSNSCSVLGGGFGLKNANIVDNGGNNKYQNSSTFYWSGDTSVASGRAPLEVKNTASNVGKTLSILNTSGVETLTVLGSGQLLSESHGYFSNGIRWRTGNGTKTDRGLFLSTASPEGVTTASTGSICVQTSNSKVFVKKSGAGDTGWRELAELNAGTTAQRPTVGLSAGISYFDTTLNKPVWRNSTDDGWVDATGATV